MNAKSSTHVEIEEQPGHCIRRLQQIAVALFLQETEAFAVTPIQYAALQTVANQPGIDQRRLASAIGLDTSTIAGVVDRLETRGLLARKASAEDRRVRQLSLTAAGARLLKDIVPAMLKAQQLILEPLPKKERAAFMRMLQQLVTENNEFSRAPRATQD